MVKRFSPTRRAPGQLRAALDQGRDPRIHPEELAHGQVATTKAQRAAVLQPALDEAGFQADAVDADTHRDTFERARDRRRRASSKVKREEVIEMETRMAGGDVLLDPGPGDDGEEPTARIAWLADRPPRADRRWKRTSATGLASGGIDRRWRRFRRALAPHRRRALARCQRRRQRRHDVLMIAAEYGVSAERIRQIEVAAKKMRKTLKPTPESTGSSRHPDSSPAHFIS